VFSLALATIVLAVVRPASAAVVMANANVTQALEDTSFGKAVIEGLNESELISVDVDANIVNDFLNRENVSDELGKVAEGYAQAFAGGDYDYYLSTGEIAEVIKAIEPDIVEEFGADFSDVDYDVIAENVNEYVDFSGLSIGKAMDATGLDPVLPYVLFSDYPLMVASLLGALSIFDIFLLHRKRIRTAFPAAGVPVALSGVVCCLAGLLLGPYSSVFGGGAVSYVLSLIAGVVNLLMVYGLICIAAGGVSLIVYAIINRSQSQYAQYSSGKLSTAVWRAIGLIVNASILMLCITISSIFYAGMP